MTARKAQVNGAWLAFVGSVLVLVALLVLWIWDPTTLWSSKDTTQEPLMVYCAAGIRKPVAEIAQKYEQEFGVPIRLQYDGSQKLLNSITQVDKGDLYIPGDTSYLHKARKSKLVREIIPLATMTPVLAVPKGNPKGIASLADVFAKELRIVQANPKAAAVGKVTRETFLESGDWEAFQKRVVTDKFTVNEVANDIVVGTADAGVVWDVTVRQYPKLEAVALAPFEGKSANVAVGILTCGKQQTRALHFARYLAARDVGLPIFKTHGFAIVEGDQWADKPELLLLAGAMLRPAIQNTLKEFQDREGVKITTVYNGCGILVAQMKSGEQRADAYFACDQSFMDQVQDMFLDAKTISGNQLVILVPKGNPKKITSLDDLGQPGLKVGVGHEKQCAMGALTQQTLRQGRVRDHVMKNVKVQKPTGDMLVADLLTGSLDAVIAYVSNGASASDRLDAVAIYIPCAFAKQPIAINKQSKNKHLVERLVETILTEESRKRFLAYGFTWKATQDVTSDPSRSTELVP
jgi:molybdate transport system substrate-binding protein